MQRLVLILIVSFTFSCQDSISPHQPLPTLGEPFEIALGQKITLPDENLTVEFADVLEDNRCPTGLLCVWSGNAKIAIRLNDVERNLNTHKDPGQVSISDFNIDLIALDPYPEYNVKVQKDEYQAKLTITSE